MENPDSDPTRDLPQCGTDDRPHSEDAEGQTSPTTAENDQRPSSSSSPSSLPASSAAESPHPPSTTLWENFMSSFRNVVHGNTPRQVQPGQQSAAHSTPAPLDTSDSTAEQQAPLAAAPSATTEASSSNARPDPQPNTLPRPPVFFRMPFNGPDGNPELLAFHPQPLPRREGAAPSAHQPASQNQPNPPSSPPTSTAGWQSNAHPHPTGQPGANAGGTTAAPHSHPHPDGHVPIAPLFVPFGASPLPFSFIYDANTQTAWPIAHVTPGTPPGGPAPDAPESQQPRLVAGPPFRIILDVHFTAAPEPERPDPQKAATYVKQLERADAELRARMARLGMGSIGGFGDTSTGDEQDALLGCGICLDSYASEDRPEWIDGPKSQDEAVVAVPCHGHHTLHAGCLRDWLEKLPPSQWTCPFCRASLNPSTAHGQPHEASSRASPKPAATASAPAVHTTLRDEVRARERKRAWRCDAPACFPRYPLNSQADGGHLELPETSDDMTTDLVKLAPCHHEVHLDCLCTSMRIENDLVGDDDLDALLSSDSGANSSATPAHTDAPSAAQSRESEPEQEQPNTVGKWVTCPTCRKECWAELPLRRRPQRAAPDVTQAAAATSSAPGDVQVPTKTVSFATQPESTALQALQTERIGTSPEQDVDPDEEAVVDALLVSN